MAMSWFQFCITTSLVCFFKKTKSAFYPFLGKSNFGIGYPTDFSKQAGILQFFYRLPFIHTRLLSPQKIIRKTMTLGLLKVSTKSDENLLQLTSSWITPTVSTVISIVSMVEKTLLLSLINHLHKMTTQPCLAILM